MIHTSHRRLFLHEKNCIGMIIRYILIQTSVSCVNIVPFKGKDGAISRYLGAPDPSKSVFIRVARPELVGLAFYIRQIGPVKAILEPLKVGIVSTQ